MMKVTVAQAMKAVVVCQNLSNAYREIHLFRFDPLTGYIFILAGKDIELIIIQDGNWEFIDGET
jgi:hypothetical protein